MRKNQKNDNSSGKIGENAVTEMLKEKGFCVVIRNYRTRFGEIDIIAEDDKYLIFVEVKTRKTSTLATPQEAVTLSKQRKIIMAAQEFLQEFPTQKQPRFDVVAVTADNGEIKNITHFTNAFLT